MTYEELKIQLDLCDPIDVLNNVGRQCRGKWFVVCDEGDCHLFRKNGTEDDIRKIDKIGCSIIPMDIKKIIIPDSVTCIGDSAFWDCRELTSVTIPDSVTSIRDSAFYNCRKLTSVMIPNSVMSIGPFAFYRCSELTNMMISDRVTNIWNSAFEGCCSLRSVTIPDSVKSIGDYAFYGCCLESVTIPDSVMSIGDDAFYGCDKLNSLVFKGKTMDEVKEMDHYPWGIDDGQ